MEVKELKKIIRKIEKRKVIIAKNRDELRDLYDSLSGCIESFDNGIDSLAAGIMEIENAIDSISEVV